MESAAAKLRQELGIIIALATRVENENFISQLRIKLGDANFERAWADGQTMSLDQALTLSMRDAGV